jgi:hypothetical protein
MRLQELNPQFVKHEMRDSVKIDVHVSDINIATGITFLCPVCFKKNNGSVGTHGITVTFRDRRVPDELGSHNKEGLPSRWAVSGTNYENLTLSPSIDISQDLPGEWHGFITNGEIS